MTPAQRNVLLKCSQAVGGTIYRTAQNRLSCEALQRRGLVEIRSFDPPSWAHAHRPRAYTVTITIAGREAIQ